MGFRLVPKSAILKTLNGVMVVILRFFVEFGIALGADYVEMVEDGPMQSATEIM